MSVRGCLPVIVIAAALLLQMVPAMSGEEADSVKKGVVHIGTRVEMFVDDWLIDRMDGVSIKIHPPVKREVVMTFDKPWEGIETGYFSVVQNDSTIRLYYRGSSGEAQQVTCYAESKDGIYFTRPSIGTYEFDGSFDNNIVWRGVESHNFAPFRDTNPEAKSNERYKAVGGVKEGNLTEPGTGLFGLASPDGLHWHRIQDRPLDMRGAFDSLNVAFYDESAGCYRLYSRYWDEGYRAIQGCTSTNFASWTEPRANQYPKGTPKEHLYTNAAAPCPGAPHILLAFPMRFVQDRRKVQGHPHSGVSDALIMTSRDGVNWERHAEAWIRPGNDVRNWTDRNNMVARGIVQTGPDEFSMYVSEHYRWEDNRLRKLTIRRHGFGSVHASYAGGEFVTRPMKLSGEQLVINYATSAAGSVQVEIQDESGRALDGYSLEDYEPMYGDELDAAVRWRSGSSISSLNGKAVRFRFVMRDADLYSLCAASSAE